MTSLTLGGPRRSPRLVPAALLVAALGCAPGVPPPPLPVPVAPPAPEPGASPPIVVVEAPPEAPPPPAPEPTPLPSFPPPAFTPPVARTAKPGDGVWAPLVAADDRSAPAILYRTTVHPDRIKPDVYVAVVAVDLRRVALRLVAGTREPLSTTVPDTRRPGLIPTEDLPDLVAVMNGGFMTRHGAWGMMIGGDVFLPAHDDGCMVSILAGGGVSVRAHTAHAAHIAPAAPDAPEVLAYRQTPPCLLEQREVSPALLGADKPRRWGLSESGGVEIRRSALGLADGGRTLLYGLGEQVTPRALAEAMRAAGAISAAELDVNWSYTRFLLYRPAASPGDPPEVEATLVPKLKHAPGQYVKKPADRDFFYLTRRR